MKKILIYVSAAMTILASCAKVDPVAETGDEISFEVAKYIRTRASGLKYEGTFGTYSWFNGTDEQMVNERVGLSDGAWRTLDNTYYWPKSGSIDFISYSPFEGTSEVAGTFPVVSKTESGYSFYYPEYTVGDTDLMYADLATCSSNVNEITDDADGTADSGFTGVPTLFRHALARVSFRIQANFTSYTDGDDVTTWELTVTSAKLSGVYTKGDCALTWANGASEWTKPEGNVWTNPSGQLEDVDLLGGETITLTDEPSDLSSLGNYVLPQALKEGEQTLELTVHIKTTLPNGRVVEEDYQTGAVDLVSISDIDAWEMNQNIVYVIKIKPTATTGGPGTEDSPEDVTITYDPAVADWDFYSRDFTIQL